MPPFHSKIKVFPFCSGGFFFLLIYFLLFNASNSYLIAQTREAVIDTSVIVQKHSPNKALLLSTFLPGAGQIYNRKYWKPPVIYAGFAVCAYFISTNNTRYIRYRKAYIQRADGDTLTVDPYMGIYTEGNLLELKDYYRRNRDLTVIITVAVYVLNLLDAYVDGHLFNFNVNDDISMQVMPDYRSDDHFKNQIGLKVNLTLR